MIYKYTYVYSTNYSFMMTILLLLAYHLELASQTGMLENIIHLLHVVR